MFEQKKRLSRPKQQIEMGTQNKGNIDYDWLPKETLEGMSKLALILPSAHVEVNK